ncbi:hypothetical protein HanPI659440_Chr05g0218561 [Helianthus annuus]|nr:hypothetical protein HanPI659440_Chr05g0218561 [Helianthus annuus]
MMRKLARRLGWKRISERRGCGHELTHRLQKKIKQKKSVCVCERESEIELSCYEQKHFRYVPVNGGNGHRLLPVITCSPGLGHH